MKKIYVTPLCKTVFAQMAHNLLGESRWGVNSEVTNIDEYSGLGDESDGILWNSRDFFGGSLWDDD